MANFLTRFMGGLLGVGVDEPVEARTTPGSLEDFVGRLGLTRNDRAWRQASIREALSVPAILRANTLIANTGGSLTPQAFRNGALLGTTPRVISRPDPFSTPRDFYRDVFWNMGTRGEAVLWIASRDSQGYANALINVPLHELTVEDNPDNRLFPTYAWGKLKSTRFSPVNPSGDFVHITYIREGGDLRGSGPLQLCGAAVSVAVEAQEWAANFYGDGGNPSVIIKSAIPLGGRLEETDDDYEDGDDAQSEADRLRAQWVDKPNNVPRVIDSNIESVDYVQPTEAGAQMLESRDYNNGDAARMYGMPGALLEYSTAGASLTYQNLSEVWVNFLRGCLAPNYLEPVEQALSDLLPRSTVVRFLTDGLQRADPKTRWEIYQIMVAVLGQERAAEVAAVREDLAPGNPEVAPVEFAPAGVAPTRLPQARTAVAELRCDGVRTRRRGAIAQLEPCNRLLSETGTFVGSCPRCKKAYAAA